LTNAQLPKLSGSMQTSVPDSFSTSGIISGNSWSQTKSDTASKSARSTIYGFKIDIGGGQSHNNLQPYITVYMWRRIT